MKSNRKLILAAALAAGCVAGSSVLAATEIPLVKDRYLPWGAEFAGNDAGTIPDYTGAPAIPADYDPARPGVRPDPFRDEAPLFVVDQSNMQQYVDNIPEGIKHLLEKYPTFKLNVYPSHRTANYPDFYIKNTLKNIDSCKNINNGLGLEGCYAGLPFPFPETGNEVMWNRFLKYDQYAFSAQSQATNHITSGGQVINTGSGPTYGQAPIFDPARINETLRPDDIYNVIRINWTGPARKVGEVNLLTDAIDMLNVGAKAWTYMPGQRRVKLAPDLAYDTPGPASGGASIMDETSIFYGPLDRFDFKIVGKKEMIIPYNAYKATNPVDCPSSKGFATTGHLNPECMRWELHRVWVVEATVKDGQRHIYPRRLFYFDEDLTGAGIGVGFDSAGQVYRVTHGLPITAYEGTGHFTDAWVNHDLRTGSYLRVYDTTETGGWVSSDPKPMRFFTPAAMAGSGVR